MSDFEFDRNAPLSNDMQEYAAEVRARQRRTIRRAAGWFVAGAAGLTAILIAAGNMKDGVVDARQERVTVCDKEAVGGRYRVEVADASGDVDVVEVKRTIIVGGYRQDAAEQYAELEEGVTYDMTFNGKRIEAIDLFPNLVSAEPVPASEQANYCGPQ